MTWVNEYIQKLHREGLYDEMREDYFRLKNTEWYRQWGLHGNYGRKLFGYKSNITKEFIVTEEVINDWATMGVWDFCTKYRIGRPKALKHMKKYPHYVTSKLKKSRQNIEDTFKTHGYLTIKKYLDENGYLDTTIKYGISQTVLSNHIRNSYGKVSKYAIYNY